MRLRSKIGTLAAFAVVLVLAAHAVAASPIGIYRNSMETKEQRAEVTKLFGNRCGSGGSDHAFRIMVGKSTMECGYRAPVVGRDLEISATARLLSSTPESIRHGAFLGVDLRAGEAGAHYQLAVFPLQRKAQLLKTLSNGEVKYLHIEKDVSTVKGVNRANELRLRAFNVTHGTDKGGCRILAFVGSTRVADVIDPAAGELEGRAAGFSVGATRKPKGVVGSVDDVVIRVPNPVE
ncbi:MAG TPA: hypothetical protein VIE64_08840 [Solirubrobacterales bacterium]|jgi:hypothetical protein